MRQKARESAITGQWGTMVDTMKQNGRCDINVQPTVVKKERASKTARKCSELKAEIDQMPNATDEEKAAAKAKVDEAVIMRKCQSIKR